MDIIWDHYHGASLYVTQKRNGNYNLWEVYPEYGYSPKMIINDLTMEELINWRDLEFKNVDYLPEIDVFRGNSLRYGKPLLPFLWKIKRTNPV